MFYSIFPPEVVFDESDEESPNTYQEISYDNRQFIVEPAEDNRMRIVQLLSSDPLDFMNAGYQPGTLIEFTPQIYNE